MYPHSTGGSKLYRRLQIRAADLADDKFGQRERVLEPDQDVDDDGESDRDEK